MKKICVLTDLDYTIYTDGACLGNPAPGGWAAIIYNNNSGEEKKIVGSDLKTTNNRMELIAVIKALEALPPKCSLRIYTDSKYVINGMSSWIFNWKKHNWLGASKKPIKNKDLWIILDKLCDSFSVNWKWVKGHSGDKNNDAVDEMARGEAIKLN